MLGEIKRYSFGESIDLFSDHKKRKFLESVELVVKLNLNTKKPEHNFKDLCILPHPIPRQVRVLVVDDSLTSEEIKALGIDHYGGKEILDRIADGWMDFDVMITNAKMMPMVSKLGKILGPRNLMPSPKLGTVTQDISKTVTEFKKGKVSVKNDSFGNVHVLVGKADFPREHLVANCEFILNLIKSKKPKNFKGRYLDKVHLTTTMGPSYPIEFTPY